MRTSGDPSTAKSSNSGDGYEWHMLDGENTILHALNAKFGGIKIANSELASEYLDFFCSFLCGEEGLFVLIQDVTELEQIDDDDLFEQALFESRHYIVHQEPKQFPAELGWENIRNRLGEKVSSVNAISSDDETRDETEPRLKTFKRVILYGRDFFESSFEISESGRVEMAEDHRIVTSNEQWSSSDLAVRTFTTMTLPDSGLVLFTKSNRRESMSAGDFMEKMRTTGGFLRASNVLITGDVMFSPAEERMGFECDNVRFLGNVTFDHCRVLSVLRFNQCRFLGSVCAPGTLFESQVILKYSDIFALPRIGKVSYFQKNKLKVEIPRPGEQRGIYACALNLDHARVEGNLSLERLTAHGSVSCRHLTVQSDANFCGLQVLPLVDSNGNSSNKKSKPSKAYKAASASGPVLLDLQRSAVTGAVNLGISIDRQGGVKRNRGLRQTRVTVCGDCRFDTMSIGKSLIIEGLAVVKLKGEKVDHSEFGLGIWDRNLTMSNVKVQGNIQSWEYESFDLAGATINPPLFIDGTIDLKWSRVTGYVDLRGSHVTKKVDCIGMSAAWLTLGPSQVEVISADNSGIEEAGEIDWANYSLTAAHQPKVQGNASADWIEHFQRRMSIIQGNLELGNAIIPGGVTLTGATVEGTVDICLGAQLGQVKALPVLGVRREAEKRTVVKQTAFLGRLSIRDSTIAGPVYLWSTRIGSEDAGGQDKAPRPVIDITTSKLKGGLYLHARSNWEGRRVVRELLDAGKHWSDDKVTSTDWVDHQGTSVPKNSFEDGADAYFWQTIPDVLHTSVKGDVDILASDLGADLDLTNTDVKGRIRINDSYVKCDVRAVTCLQELEPKSKAVNGSKQGQALHTELKTECSQFEFQAIRCDGDLMLAGLAVAGEVDGRNAVVRGHGEFVHGNKQAAIAGDLTLCGFEVGLLKIGGQSFQNSGTIDLARATISTLEISLPLPSEINLQSIKVGYWKVGTEPGGGKDLELLEASKPYDSWAYKSLENARAAEGNDDLADKIHVARNKKELAEAEKKSASTTNKPLEISCAALIGMGVLISPSWPWLACILCLVGIIALAHYIKTGESFFPLPPWLKRSVWDRVILGNIMGFGTRLFPAFCAWLLLAFSLGVVLSNPRNVQPTFAAVNVGIGKVKLDADSAADAGAQIRKMRAELQKQWRPQEQEWGFWNHGLWLALDITVPLIPFNLHDEWEPKDTTEGTVFPCCSYSEMPVAPKTLANWFVPASWIIWTLIATGMAGVIRTRN